MSSAVELPTNSKPVSTNRKIFRAAFIVASLSIIARVGTILREMVVARWFGRGDALDAYLISLLLPSLVVMLIAGAVSSAAIPVILEARRNEDEAVAGKLIGDVLLLSVAALIVMAVALALFSPWYLPVIAHGFPTAKLALTRTLLYCLLPWMVFSGLGQVAGFVLNAEDKFALPALTPLVTPVLTMFCVIAAARIAGPFAIAAGASTGSVLEASFLMYVLARSGVRLRFRWNGIDHRMSTILAQCLPLLGGALLTTSVPVVDQAMAAMLPTGSVSALGYGNKVVGAIVALGANALGTALLPYLSRMAIEHDWQGCRHTLKRYTGIILASTIPVTLVLIWLSTPIVQWLFQRGAFTAADTQLVSWVQICYSLQIPFNLLGILFVRFISATRRNDLLFYVAAMNFICNVGLNFILMKKFGVAGIGLSTSLVYAFSLSVLVCLCIRIITHERFHALSEIPQPSR